MQHDDERLALRISSETLARLDKVATRERRTRSFLVREAVNEWLDRHERKAKTASRQQPAAK